MSKKKTTTFRYALRLAGVTLALAALGVAGWWGWQWQQHLKVERIDIVGARHAPSPDLIELARVDTSMRLYGIDPALIEDRVRRHPWVQSASVARLPTGTLRLQVEERTPEVLVLDAEGRLSHYLDGQGFQMPVDSGAVYDVPLLRGLEESYHPVRRVESSRLRALLRTLASTDDTLISELEQRSGEIWLYTAPTEAHGTIPVRLGSESFDERLGKLEVFWQQAVLPRAHTTFEMIDVRFDGQVVVREAEQDRRS